MKFKLVNYESTWLIAISARVSECVRISIVVSHFPVFIIKNE